MRGAGAGGDDGAAAGAALRAALLGAAEDVAEAEGAAALEVTLDAGAGKPAALRAGALAFVALALRPVAGFLGAALDLGAGAEKVLSG